MRLLILIFAIILVACSAPKDNKLTFKNENGEALLLGDKITALDSNLTPLNTLTLNAGQQIELIASSDSLFNKTEDYCNGVKYVKVRLDNKSFLVDGRCVYKAEITSDQNKSVKLENDNLELVTTSYFGIGTSDDEGLTFCSKFFEPLLVKNDNTYRFIKLIHNELTEKASWNKDALYFELYANDGAYDKISQISTADNEIILTIHREYQEGENDFKVRLTNKDGQFYAEHIEVGEIKY